ncbi:hypothetical protein [Pseudoflavitalea rhizosphaerae]|uniref:hypothetical protein n=1 Tax=Pseudoflavitalea rhizosphaerae TaxID=1884793 RepID=UPI000F8F7468|nr:hypothetical protein [Pseudoflavitalea rhizosphaerae]
MITTFPHTTEKLFFTCLFAILLILACSGTDKDDPTFLKTYGGNPYMGSLQVDIILPDGKYAHTNYGKGSAQFIGVENNKARMILFGAISNEKGDAGFTVDGNCNKLNWQCKSDSVQLNISDKGMISGTARRFPQQFNFSGKISDVRLEFTTELKTLQKASGGLPAGTRYVFKYVLRREVSGKGTTKSSCKKIVWKPQYIGNFDGSGTTVMVPHCAD